MTELVVWRAELADLESVVPLFDQYREFYQARSDLTKVRAFLSDRLRNQDSVLFLAASHGATVGLANLYPVFSSITIGRAFILNDLYVVREARGRGVGRALLDHAVAFARDVGALYLELATQASNHTAQRLYQRAGWRRETDFLHYEFSCRP